MSKYKIKDLAVEISQRIDNPKTSGYDKFVGLEHYDSGEVRISRFGRTDNLDSSVKEFKSGDILIARRNVYLKRAGLVDFDGVTSGDSIVIRAKNDINKRLLPFVFNTKEFWDFANQFADGSMSKRLSPKLLMEYETALPDTEEERIKLADLLWSVFDTAMSYKEMIKQSDELVQSRFVEMFEHMDLSKKQKNWVKLGDVTEIFTGTTPSTTDENNWGGEHLWITPAELNDNSFYVYNTERKLTDKGLRSKALSKMPINTVLLSTRAPIGKTAIVGKSMACNQGFKNFVCKQSLDPIYLYILLKYNKEYLNSIGSGTTFKELSKTAVSNIEIPVPKIALQKQFAIFVKQVDKSKFNLQEGIEKLEAVNKKIMNQYLKKGD